jgi:hypothetical protein
MPKKAEYASKAFGLIVYRAESNQIKKTVKTISRQMKLLNSLGNDHALFRVLPIKCSPSVIQRKFQN